MCHHFSDDVLLSMSHQLIQNQMLHFFFCPQPTSEILDARTINLSDVFFTEVHRVCLLKGLLENQSGKFNFLDPLSLYNLGYYCMEQAELYLWQHSL